MKMHFALYIQIGNQTNQLLIILQRISNKYNCLFTLQICYEQFFPGTLKKTVPVIMIVSNLKLVEKAGFI